MTRAQRTLFRLRGSLWLLTALMGLGGAVGIAFLWISAESHRADELAAEADRRGTAVSTLAGDVRALREQVKAAGKTPVAPDPAAAISNLPDRTTVPVPIPGPKGDAGVPGPASTVPGPAGSPGPTSTVPGPAGPTGVPGTGATGPAGPAGPAGKDGTDGANGTDGRDGTDGAAGQPPAGWSWTDSAGVTYTCTPIAGFDPAAPRYQCTADPAPTPSPKPGGLPGLAALTTTAVYRRLR